jgi:3-phosphoshikimate 1-carboxyvinyltransferase
MAPIASLTGEEAVFTGRESLMRRPLAPLIEALGEIGVAAKLSEQKLVIQGRADGGVAHIQGDVSSQFISGLLFAGPLMPRGLRIDLTTPVESRNYVLQTLQTMNQHGIDVKSEPDMSAFQIDGRQTYSPANHSVSGDYSSAAFALAAAAITGSTLLVRNLPRNDREPDAQIVDILSRMGGETHVTDNGISVEGSELRGIRVDLRDNPDLGPVLAVLGVFAKGETIIEGAKRLRHKESDRLEAISTELNSLGANIKTTEDGLKVRGPSSLKGGLVDSHGDHRIAMALAVAALNARSKVEIGRAECVSKSYPNFFDDLRSIGVEVIER